MPWSRIPPPTRAATTVTMPTMPTTEPDTGGTIPASLTVLYPFFVIASLWLAFKRSDVRFPDADMVPHGRAYGVGH